MIDGDYRGSCNGDEPSATGAASVRLQKPLITYELCLLWRFVVLYSDSSRR